MLLGMPFLHLYTLLMFFIFRLVSTLNLRARPRSKKSILSSVQQQHQIFKQHWQFTSGSKYVGLQITLCNIICQLEHDEGSTTLRTSLCEADSLIFLRTTDTQSGNSNHLSFTKSASRLFFSIAVSKQLYAAPYLVVCTATTTTGRARPSRTLCWSTRNSRCISLTPRPMTVVFGLVGTCLHVYKSWKNGIPANG